VVAAKLAGLIDALVRHDGEPPAPLSDPYAIVLHEIAGYLISDQRRDDVYARLVALAPSPAALLGTHHDDLLAIARDGGMRPEERVERWRMIAEITLEEADGDLIGTLHALPLPRAKKLLARYPLIGTPGVDRILLFAGIAAVPSVDSNGLRVLERYGVIAKGQAYVRAYREACGALAGAFGERAESLRRSYTVLRRHGKTICRNARPECPRCPVAKTCPSSDLRQA
jgi:endonuclease III